MSPRLAVLALGSALAFPSAAPAAAADDPYGAHCGFSATTDPTGLGAPDTVYAELHGGPVTLTDLPADVTPTVVHGDLTVTPGTVTPDLGDPGDTQVTGTLTCAIQVGGTGAYTDPDAAAASAFGAGVAYLAPTPVTYRAGILDDLYVTTTVCTTDGHGDVRCLYYDAPTRSWVPDETQARGAGTFEEPAPICLEPVVCVE